MPNSNTPKLNDTQLIILSSASQREDRRAPVPENVSAGPLNKAVAKLTSLGFLKEVRVKPGEPLWRSDEGKRLGLKITKAGADAIGVEPDRTSEEAAPEPQGSTKKAPVRKGRQAAGAEARGGSKRAQVIGLMQRKAGATLDEMVAVTAWLPHTARAALTGLRHQGYAIEKSKNREGKTAYRIDPAAQEVGSASLS